MKKFLNVLSNVLITLIVIFAVVITSSVILSTRNKSGLPSLFGYSLLTVQSDSMESENGFFVGDMIVIKELSYEEKNNLHVGDVITFYSEIGEQVVVETHRIVEDTYTESQNQVVNGIWHHGNTNYYVTKGDNTVAVDQWLDGRGVYYSHAGNIIGIWTGARIPVLGKVMNFLQSSMGFMICVVIPIALFFIYELYVFIVTLTRKQKEKTLAEVADKEAELKAAAVAEFLAKQQAEGVDKASEDTNADEAKPEEKKTDDKEEKAEETKEEKKEDSKDEKSEENPEEKAEEKKDEPAKAESDSKEKKNSKKDKKNKKADEKKSEEPAKEESKEESAEKTEDKKDDESKANAADEISEEEKQRIIQEYLAKQAAEGKKDK